MKNILYSLADFQIFSLNLVFTMMCLGIVFFVFILLREYRVFSIWVLMFFIYFKEFSDSDYTSSFFTMSHNYIMLFQCPFISLDISFSSFCMLFLIPFLVSKLCKLCYSLLILWSFVSNMLLNPIIEFLVSMIFFYFQHFHFTHFVNFHSILKFSSLVLF